MPTWEGVFKQQHSAAFARRDSRRAITMPDGQRTKNTMTWMTTIVQVVAGIVGLIIGAYCVLAAMFLGATNHWHWDSVGWYAALTLVLTPLAFVRLVTYKTVPIKSTFRLLGAALVLDLSLALFTWIERDDIYSFEATYSWFASWSIWQIATVLTLILSSLEAKYG